MFLFYGGLEYYNTFFDKTIVKIEIVLYSLQFIFLILYSFPKARYKFQKLQTLVVLLYAFQLGYNNIYSVSSSWNFGGFN